MCDGTECRKRILNPITIKTWEKGAAKFQVTVLFAKYIFCQQIWVFLGMRKCGWDQRKGPAWSFVQRFPDTYACHLATTDGRLTVQAFNFVYLAFCISDTWSSQSYVAHLDNQIFLNLYFQNWQRLTKPIGHLSTWIPHFSTQTSVWSVPCSWEMGWTVG